MNRILPALFVWSAIVVACPGQGKIGSAFYLAGNSEYTIVESTLDSLRFTLDKTLRRDERGHLVSISSFVDPDGQVMGWHDFGNLEGPGWAANAVGGAYEIYSWGAFRGREARLYTPAEPDSHAPSSTRRRRRNWPAPAEGCL